MARDVLIPGLGIVKNVPESIAFDQLEGRLTEEDKENLRFPTSDLKQRAIGRRLMLEEKTGLSIRPGELEMLKVRGGASRITRERIFEKAFYIIEELGITEDDLKFVTNDKDQTVDAMLIRLPGEEDWVQFDSPDIVTFSDWFELGASVTNLSTAGSMGLWLMANATQGGLIMRALASGVGAAGGLIAESEIKRFQGEEQTPRLEVGGQAAAIGLATAVTEGASDVLRGTRQIMKGTIEGAPEGIPPLVKMTRVLQKRGAVELIGVTPADIPPVLRNVTQKLAPQTGIRAEVFQLERYHGILRLIEREIESLKAIGKDFSVGEFANSVNALTEKLMSTIRGPIKIDSLRAGTIAAQGIKAFHKIRTELHDVLYKTVRRVSKRQDISMDLTSAKAEVQRLKTGIQGEVSTQAQFDELMATGKTSDRQMLSGAVAEVLEAMDKFLRLPDTVSNLRTDGGLFTAFDQIRALRTEVFNLMDSGNGTQQRLAAKFHHQLTQVMENPVGGDKLFKTALRKANKARSATEKAMERLNTRELARLLDKDPEKIGRTLIEVSNPDRVRDLKAIFGASGRPEKFESIKRGWVDRLRENPATLEAALDQWGTNAPRALRLLLTEGEEAGLRQIANAEQAMSVGPIAKLVRKQTSLGEDAIEALLNEDPAAIERLLQSVGGKHSRLGRQMRLGVWLNLLNDARSKEFVIDVVKARLKDTIAKLQRSPFWGKVMTTKGEGGSLGLKDVVSDDEIAGYIVDLMSVFPAAGDLASGMAGMNLSNSLLTVSGFVPAQIKKSRNALMNFIFNSKFAQNRMGDEVKKGGIGWLRPTGIVLGDIIGKAEEDARALFGEEGEDDRPLITVDPDILKRVTGGRVQIKPEAGEFTER